MRAAVAVSVLGLTASLCFASAATASWTPPTTLSDVSDFVTDEAVARGDDGTVAIAWSRYIDGYHSQLVARVRPAGRAWGPPQTLSVPEDGQNEEPSVAVDADGNAIVAWASEQDSNPGTEGIRVADAPAGRPFSPSVRINDDDNGYGQKYPVVGFDARGGAIAIWKENDDLVHFSVRPPGGAFSPDDTVALTDGETFGRLSFAIGRDGTAVVATDTFGHVDTAVRPAGGRFGRPVRLDQKYAGNVQTAVGRDGTAVVTWYRDDGYHGPGTGTYVSVADPGADHVGPAETVVAGSALPVTPIPDASGEITLLGSGGLTEPYRSAGVWTITGKPGAWGKMQSLGDAEIGPSRPPVAGFDGDGTLHVVWQRYDNLEDGHEKAVVYARSRPAGGSFTGDPIVLARYDAIMSGPLIATSRAPGAVSAWQVYTLGLLMSTDTFSTTGSSSPGQALRLSASALPITLPARAVVPRLRTVRVRATGAAEIPWTARENHSWVTVIPDHGTASKSDASTLTVRVAPKGLAPGTHTATIRIHPVRSRAPDRTITVTLRLG